MDKLMELLKKLGYEVKDEHKEQIKEVLPKTEGLLNQAEVDEVVETRLARQKKLYETQIGSYEKKLEGLANAEDLEKLKAEQAEKVKDLEKQLAGEKVTNAIKLAAKDAGAVDIDYILFQIQKKNYKADFNDEGKLYLLNDEGKPMMKDGHVCGAEKIMNDLKEEFPSQFGEVNQVKKNPGPTNPGGGNDQDEAKTLAAEIGKRHAAKRKSSLLTD